MQSLPIDAHLPEILRGVRESRGAVVIAEPAPERRRASPAR